MERERLLDEVAVLDWNTTRLLLDQQRVEGCEGHLRTERLREVEGPLRVGQGRVERGHRRVIGLVHAAGQDRNLLIRRRIRFVFHACIQAEGSDTVSYMRSTPPDRVNGPTASGDGRDEPGLEEASQRFAVLGAQRTRSSQ